jgi:hypothetical protein
MNVRSQQGRFRWHAKGDAPKYRQMDGQIQAVLLLYTQNTKEISETLISFWVKITPAAAFSSAYPAPEVPKA